MGGIKYHIKNKLSKKEMKKIRNHPLPTLLMAHICDSKTADSPTKKYLESEKLLRFLNAQE